MKTFNEFVSEVLSMVQRRAAGRRMKILGKKSSTKMRKKLNIKKPLSQEKAQQKAQKAVRKMVMQKTVGKSKDLASMSIGQKAALEKKVDKRMKAMGGKVKSLVQRKKKDIVKKHRIAAAIAKKSAN